MDFLLINIVLSIMNMIIYQFFSFEDIIIQVLSNFNKKFKRSFVWNFIIYFGILEHFSKTKSSYV